MISTTARPGNAQPCLVSDQVLRIARLDAEAAYHDLTPYRICIALETDGWHVDYEVTDAALNGGGPHYVIDPGSGSIVYKRYEQ